MTTLDDLDRIYGRAASDVSGAEKLLAKSLFDFLAVVHRCNLADPDSKRTKQRLSSLAYKLTVANVSVLELLLEASHKNPEQSDLHQELYVLLNSAQGIVPTVSHDKGGES